MKKLIFIIFSLNVIFAKEYSIIAFSTKKFDIKSAKLFIKRFPNGVIKKYTKFVEYKIEPFKSYDEAKEFLYKVKKYYKYPLIVRYNPNIGKVLYPKRNNKYIIFNINYQNKVNRSSLIQKNESKIDKSYLVHCKNKCGCIKNKTYNWEINKTKIIKNINVKVKKYLEINNSKQIVYFNKRKNVFLDENNISKLNLGCRYPSSSSLIYYIDLYGNYFKGQKYTYQKDGYLGNLKLGLMYEKYFLDNWKFYTDDRIIFSRKKINSHYTSVLYFDVNELYLRSYCVMCNYLDILIGRKKTKDYKSWWFNNYLDEIKLFSENDLVTFNIIGATRINNNIITNENSSKYKIKNSGYLITNINYQFYYKNNLGFYYIYEDAKPRDVINKQRMHYLGIYVNGIKGNIKYWGNLGYSNGKRNYINYSKNFDGYGLDIGGIYFINHKNGLGLNFAYAQDKFTQPLIANNYSDILSKNFNFYYYGMVFNPTVENINILSLYWLYKINNFKKFITLLSFYNQVKAKKEDYNPTYLFYTNGNNKNLGKEINIIYQYLKTRDNKLRIGFGYFIGNKAYDHLKNKNAFRVFINYRHYWK